MANGDGTWYVDSVTTGGTTWGGPTAVPGITFPEPFPCSPPGAAHTHIFEDFDDCSKKKKEENMRGLYEIHAVNPKTEEIIGPILVVAKDEQGAILKADLPQEVRSNSEQYDILIECVGDVRVKKDVQKVEVVKED